MADPHLPAEATQTPSAQEVVAALAEQLPTHISAIERIEVQQATPTHYMCRIQQVYAGETEAFDFRLGQ